MDTRSQIQSLAQLRDAFISGAVPTPSAPSILAFLDLAQSAFGEGFHAPYVLATEQAFNEHFPKIPTESLATAYGDEAIYNRCRQSLLRHCKLAGLWQDDPYPLLNQLAREIGAPPVNQRLLAEHFENRLPSQITRDLALNVDRRLRGKNRQWLRCSLTTLDRLRSLPMVQDRGFLGPDMIGPLPQYRDGDRLPVALPSELSSKLADIPKPDANRARRAFEIATDLGVLEKSAGRWALIEGGGEEYHTRVTEMISLNSANINLRALSRLLHAANPALASNGSTSKNEIGRSEARLHLQHSKIPVGKSSKASPSQVNLPADITKYVEAYKADANLSRKQSNALHNVLCRLFAHDLETEPSTVLSESSARFGEIFPELAPSTCQTYGSVLRTFLRHSGLLDPWSQLRARASELALPGVDSRGLALLERLARAHKPTLTPACLNRKIAAALLKKATSQQYGQRFREGVRSLDLLRKHLPGLLPGETIGSFRDSRKRGNLDLPPELEHALRAHAASAGFTAAGTKAQLVAVRKLYTCTADQAGFDADITKIPWSGLIDSALRENPDALAPYMHELTRFADRMTRTQSPGWKNLSRVIVGADVARVDNPLDALEDVAALDGLEPWQLDREWAWTHERSLRPDLRITWSRNITRLDALREIAEISSSGLLPAQPLGPLPARGERLKNALFPLPRQLESALSGEDKPLLEAAHFVWRCLRGFGVHARGDNPNVAALVSESTLKKVLKDQSIMALQSARIHVDRLRDWRESRQDLQADK